MTITLDRDAKRNAVNAQMGEEVLECLDLAEREEARVVVLRANSGAKVWCAGHDLRELDPAALYADNPIIKVFQRVQDLSIPVVAMVEGSVHAGGLIILLGVDIVVATDNAEVAIASSKLGIPLEPEVYAPWIAVMGIHKAKELLFTARAISADDAYHAGLYNHVVSVDELEPATNDVVTRILACSSEAIADAKYQLNLMVARTRLAGADRDDVVRRSGALLASPDTRARIAALLAALRG
ncbi:MAG: enoyl-CoA hydratase-related protein [Pirellulales bacterium]